MPDKKTGKGRKPSASARKDRKSPREIESSLPLLIPRRVFLTKGVGKDKEKLASFEAALRDAGIASLNLVRVSSIVPPGAKVVSKRQGLRDIKPGAITFAVMSENATDEPHRLIAASVGVAIPRDQHEKHGYLSEHHSFGQTEREAGDYAEDLAAQMLSSTLGVPFDVDKAYDERREQYKMGGLIVRTTDVTQSAVGDKNGLWTTVVAVAVLQ